MEITLDTKYGPIQIKGDLDGYLLRNGEAYFKRDDMLATIHEDGHFKHPYTDREFSISFYKGTVSLEMRCWRCIATATLST